MRDTALNREEDASILKPCNTKDISTYVVSLTGASVTADSSVGVIYRYCEKLPHDKYAVCCFVFGFYVSHSIVYRYYAYS